MPDKVYNYRPPPFIEASGFAPVRGVDFHSGQIFDILTGSGLQQLVGDLLDYPDFELAISSSNGSGPTYNVSFFIEGIISANQGLMKVKVGDKFLIANNETYISSYPYNLYRYEIISISGTPTENMGTFTVKYISDASGLGTDDPSNLYTQYYYGAYGWQGTSRAMSISRDLNHQFLSE